MSPFPLLATAVLCWYQGAAPREREHADQFMVAGGSVPQDDLVGNGGADTHTDLCRLRQKDGVINARRALLRVRRHWYPIIVDLHKFMVAVTDMAVRLLML